MKSKKGVADPPGGSAHAGGASNRCATACGATPAERWRQSLVCARPQKAAPAHVKRPRLEGEDVGQADEEELLALLRTRHLRQLEAKRRGRRHGGWPWRGARCVVVVVVVLALRPEEVVLLDLLLVARGARGVGRLTRWLVLRGRRGRRGRRLLVVGLVLRVRSEELIVLLSIHGVGKKGASEQRGAAASR
eukprot:1935723-Prymnesium_polylepis.2